MYMLLQITESKTALFLEHISNGVALAHLRKQPKEQEKPRR